MNKKLERLYYEPSRTTAFGGASKILHATRKKIPRDATIEWLEGQDAYNKHKLVRKRFSRRNYNVKNIDDLWEADLMDLRSIKSYNDRNNYLLIVIDLSLIHI